MNDMPACETNPVPAAYKSLLFGILTILAMVAVLAFYGELRCRSFDPECQSSFGFWLLGIASATVEYVVTLLFMLGSAISHRRSVQVGLPLAGILALLMVVMCTDQPSSLIQMQSGNANLALLMGIAQVLICERCFRPPQVVGQQAPDASVSAFNDPQSLT